MIPHCPVMGCGQATEKTSAPPPLPGDGRYRYNPVGALCPSLKAPSEDERPQWKHKEFHSWLPRRTPWN